MATLEYTVIESNTNNLMRLNGEAISDEIRKSGLWGLLNSLGKEGWELVLCNNTPANGWETWVLKKRVGSDW